MTLQYSYVDLEAKIRLIKLLDEIEANCKQVFATQVLDMEIYPEDLKYGWDGWEDEERVFQKLITQLRGRSSSPITEEEQQFLSYPTFDKAFEAGLISEEAFYASETLKNLENLRGSLSFGSDKVPGHLYYTTYQALELLYIYYLGGLSAQLPLIQAARRSQLGREKAVKHRNEDADVLYNWLLSEAVDYKIKNPTAKHDDILLEMQELCMKHQPEKKPPSIDTLRRKLSMRDIIEALNIS